MWARVGAESVRESELVSLKKFCLFFVLKRKIKECVFVCVCVWVRVGVFVCKFVFSWRFFGGRQLTSERGIVSRGPSSSSYRSRTFFSQKHFWCAHDRPPLYPFFFLLHRTRENIFDRKNEIELKWCQWRRNCQVVIWRRFCESFFLQFEIGKRVFKVGQQKKNVSQISWRGRAKKR